MKKSEYRIFAAPIGAIAVELTYVVKDENTRYRFFNPTTNKVEKGIELKTIADKSNINKVEFRK